MEDFPQIWNENRRSCRLNKLNKKETLHPGQPIKVLVYASHDLTLDSGPDNRADGPLLLDQIRMARRPPGSALSMVRDFAEDYLKTIRENGKK